MISLETSHVLVVAARKLSTRDTTALQHIGLTPTGLYALEDLERRGAMEQARLAHLLYVRPQTIGHLLSRFEQYGWVTRHPSGHRNYLTVDITDQGRLVLAAARHLTATAGRTHQTDHNDRRRRARPVKHGNHACPRDREAPGHDEISGVSGDDQLHDDQLHDDRLHAALNALRPFLIAVITASGGDAADDDRTVSPAPLARP